MNLEELKQRVERIEEEMGRVVIGQDDTLHQLVVALLAGGHVLLEGVPGVGKTLLARTLSHVFGASFKRIQFTPDLMPSDVTGSHVYNQREERFVFVPGPIFANLLLADEINRAPAKTQSALLEAMQDHSVTSDGVARLLPAPFFVVGTQNPVESQGTYPLPEAQLDRFLLMITVGHPDRAAERRVVEQSLAGFDPADLAAVGLERVLEVSDLLEMRSALGAVRVHPDLIDYAVEIVARTRLHRFIYLGASPRGSLGLLSCARANAAAEGRDYVTPDDVKDFAAPVLRHRLVLSPDAELAGTKADDVITAILAEVPVPKGVG